MRNTGLNYYNEDNVKMQRFLCYMLKQKLQLKTYSCHSRLRRFFIFASYLTKQVNKYQKITAFSILPKRTHEIKKKNNDDFQDKKHFNAYWHGHDASVKHCSTDTQTAQHDPRGHQLKDLARPDFPAGEAEGDAKKQKLTIVFFFFMRKMGADV